MSVSRSKRSIQNMIMGYTYHISVIILSFVSRTVFMQILGKEYLGLNGIFSDVLSLLSMADLGFSSAMAYSFYKPLAERDEEQIASLVAFYHKIYNVIAMTVLSLGLCCIPFLRYIVKTQNDIPNLELYYLLSLTSVVTSYLFVYKTTLLTADQKDFKVVRVRMIFNVLKVVLQVAVLLLWRQYILYLAIGTITGIVNNFIASSTAEKEYPYIKKIAKNKKIDNDIKQGIVDNMKSVVVYKISTKLFDATDNLIISAIVGTTVVGVYSNYLMLSQKLLLIEQILFSAMTASVGNVIAKEREENRYKVFQSLYSVGFILCGVITGVFFTMVDDTITLWAGETYKFPMIVVIAITINTYFYGALTPLWIYREATGLYRKTKYISLISSIENVVLSIVLGRMIGVAGVLFASAISRLLMYYYEPKVLFKEYFGINAGKFYCQLIINILLVISSILLVNFMTRNYIVDSVGKLIIKGILSGAFFLVVFMAAYYKTEGAQNIITRAKSMVRGSIA